MLTYDEIKETTQWVARMTCGRRVGTYKEIKAFSESEDCRDVDICAKQPTAELQHFWDAHSKFMMEYFFMSAEDFYNQIYSKCPHAFDKKPERRETIFTLAEALMNKDPKESIRIENCGNHYVQNWIDALGKLGRNYNVINWTKEHNTNIYTVAGTDEEIEALSVASNNAAIANIF